VAGLREFALSADQSCDGARQGGQQEGAVSIVLRKGTNEERFIWSTTLALKNVISESAMCANVRVADGNLIFLGVCMVLV
jgi:hypothetical protein